MKRYIYIAMFFVAALVSGCTTDTTDTEEPTLTDIEVIYTLNGEEVRSLPFNSSSRSVKIDVQLNNQNVYWKVESDSEWCSVVEGTQRGDASFTVNIMANEEFVDREPATLTFVAGQYRGDEITVTQSGNVFIMSQIYAIGSKLEGSADIEVSVQEGVEWDVVEEEWLTASKGEPVSGNGMITTPVHVEWNANTSSARYGAIGFKRNGFEEPDSQFNVFQFGDEMTYDEQNNILLPSQNAPAVEIKAPTHSVENIICPAWVTYTSTDNADNTTSYMLTFEDNPSDTRTIRESDITVKILDKAAEVAMPVVMQEYYTVSGITTANGLKLFAQTVNEGGDTSEWQKDGKVVLLNNIDMSQLTGEWVPVGTDEHPFNGTFDGQYRKIMNFTSSQPVFGVCEGATLSNILIDETSSFEATEEYMTEYTLATLAGRLVDCTVTECSNSAPVSMKASTGNNSTIAYVSGLVGRAEGSTTISQCQNYGSVEATDACSTALSQGQFYVGGIVAFNSGAVDQCSNSGAVYDAAISYYHYVAGIAAYNEGSVKTSTNTGALTVAPLRKVNNNDDSRYVNVGGIVGGNDGEVSGCTNDAALVSNSDVKIQRLGGIVGYLTGATLSGNVNTANGTFAVNGGVRQLALGGLYGEFSCDATLDFSADNSSSAGAITISDYEPSNTTVHIYVGGLVGRANENAVLSFIKPKWNSDITFNLTSKDYGAYIFGVGGVIGGVGVMEPEKVYGAHLTVEGAEVGGKMTFNANKNYTMSHKIAGIGGVVGFVSIGGATLRDCSSSILTQLAVQCKKSNGYAHHMGGIAGFIAGGESEISGCTNTGEIDNEHYNNNPWKSEGLQSGSIGGIIGAYAYNNDYEASIKVENCSNTAGLRSSRGMAGGIAGYLRNGEISGCNNTGTMANGTRSYVAGIVGVVEHVSIDNCTAVCNVAGTSAGSEVFSGGGIVGILYDGSSCTNSSFYGSIVSTTTTAGETAGGIAGSSAAGTSISGCKFGGAVRGTDITDSNYSSYVAGDSNAQVSSCSYWDGK